MVGRLAHGWAARDSSGHLSPYSFHLREVGPDDILLKVLYCGVDHTDLHQVRGEIGKTNYPLVPGHEIVGEVIEVGPQVTTFKTGDVAGVGGIIASCGDCTLCKSSLEHYCSDRVTAYNHLPHGGAAPTQGGFSSLIVVHHHFAVKIPPNLPPPQAAPLLCAGVTAYSPLKQFNGKAVKGGILGLGGVGHLAVTIAKALGHHVTVISSSDNKREEALTHLKADKFITSKDEDAMKEAADSLDYVLDTVPAQHALGPYIALLKVGGKILLVGAGGELGFVASDLILGKKTVEGSLMGSVEETAELVEMWAEKGLRSMVEVVAAEYVNEAFGRMERNDVRYSWKQSVSNHLVMCTRNGADQPAAT